MKKIILFSFLLVSGISAFAQSAEQNAQSGYVQNSTEFEIPDNKKKSKKKLKDYTYTFKGKTIEGKKNEMGWGGKTAVMNSWDGSFQVLFTEHPTKTTTYKIAKSADETHVSISLIADNDENFYFSGDNSTGTVKVTVKGNVWRIEVKDAVVYPSGTTTNPQKISGVMVFNKEW